MPEVSKELSSNENQFMLINLSKGLFMRLIYQFSLVCSTEYCHACEQGEESSE